MINYNNKTFVAVANSNNGETSVDTVFNYKQEGPMLTAHYRGGKIIYGHLIGLVDEAGIIDMRYHQLNSEGKLMTGKCISRPEILTNGKVRLHEEWQWPSGDLSSGQSIVEEI